MQKVVTVVGPKDHGRRMSLEEFEQADAREGYLYELDRGAVIVVDVPNRKHFAQVDAIKQQLYVYKAQHPEQVYRVGGGSDCKILLKDRESERHPDIAVYKTAPGGEEDWSTWVPEIVCEVVSSGSEVRDYDEKPGDYLAFGVREYWIVDAAKEEVLVLRRSGRKWDKSVVKAGTKYTTRLLPGFEFDPAPVFAAARQA